MRFMLLVNFEADDEDDAKEQVDFALSEFNNINYEFLHDPNGKLIEGVQHGD